MLALVIFEIMLEGGGLVVTTFLFQKGIGMGCVNGLVAKVKQSSSTYFRFKLFAWLSLYLK